MKMCQNLYLSLVCVVALAIGYAADTADASTAYYTPVASPSSVPCNTDASCKILNNVQVSAVTYQTSPGVGIYAWNQTCPGSPDGSTYIRPSGAVSGCFVITGFASLSPVPPSGSALSAVASMAALQALTSSAMASVKQINLAGWSVGNVEGAGAFSWLTAAQAAGLTPDNGVVVAPSGYADCSAGCMVRQFSGAVRTSFYGITSGQDCTAALNAEYAFEHVTAPGNMQINNDVACVATPSGAHTFDASTFPASQALAIIGPYIFPNLSYKAVGGSLLYAHQTISSGATFTGAPGYKYYDGSVGGGDAYLTSSAVAFPWEVDYSTQALDLNLSQPVSIHGAGIGFEFYSPSTTHGPTNITVNGFLYGDGTTAQVNLLCVNCVFFNQLGTTQFTDGFASVPLWLMNSWNWNNGNVTLRNGEALAVLQNNNENTFNSLKLFNVTSTQAAYTTFIFRDNAGTNFVTAGAVVGDQVWVTDNLKSQLLKCAISSVGRYDESGGTWTINNDMLILSGCSYSNAAGDLSQFSVTSSILFKSGLLAGNQYQMDLRPTFANSGNADFMNSYHQSRFDSGAVYVDGTEQFNVAGGQDSNWLGEAAIVSADQPGSSGNIFGHVHLECEGPENCFVSRKYEYGTYTLTGATPSQGTAGADIEISDAVLTDSAFGLASAFYGDYFNKSKVYGVAQSPGASMYAWSYICGVNCFNVNHSSFYGKQSNANTWGILDEQLNSAHPATIISPYTDQILFTTAPYSSTAAATVAFGSSIFRTSTATSQTEYGQMNTFPNSMIGIMTDTVCTTYSATAGEYIQLQFHGLQSDNSTVTIFSGSQMLYAGAVGNSVHVYASFVIPVNVNGAFQFQPVVSGTHFAGCTTAVRQVFGGF